MPKFVKFQRGSQTAYNNLKNNSRLEEDALYFIYDKNNPSNGGNLYLGEILIGGTGSGSGIDRLSNLIDVDTTGVAQGALLHYDTTTQKWVIATPKDVGTVNVSIGSANENESIADARDRLNASPKEGDIIVLDGEPYVYDGNTWTSLVSTSLSNRITIVENTVSNLQSSFSILSSSVNALQSDMTAVQSGLQAVDGKISAAIASANHLRYEPVANVSDFESIVAQASTTSASYNVVYLVPNSSGTSGNIYDEFMIINGTQEKLGSWQADLNNYVTTSVFTSAVNELSSQITSFSNNFSNYVTTTVFNNTVGSLDDLLTATEKESTNVIAELLDVRSNVIALTSSVTTINNRLQWNELL